MVDLAGVRVLVVATEQVGARMAGPAIRSLNLARQLRKRGASVTLAMPGAPDGPAAMLDGLEVAAFGTPNARGFRRLAQAADVVVTQPQRVDVAQGLARSGARIVYDLYVPSFVERIAQLSAEAGGERLRRRLLERDRFEYAAAVTLGDGFICASERQRDMWLGALGQAGRLDLDLLTRDPRADALCAVVPFGVDDAAPPPVSDAERPLRGAVVPEDAIIALWTGGLWNWFDPVLVVEALARARRQEPRLQLVVMGVTHPEAAWQEQAASVQMRERARDLGLLAPGGGVTLLQGWVPYAERHRYLLDADLAVSAHHDSLETRFSYRTRFLDQLWAGLPTLTTAGGELTERMVDAGAARAIADGDLAGWEQALVELARDPDERDRMSVAASTLVADLRWSRVVEPLAQTVARLASGADVGARGRLTRSDVARYLALLTRVRVEAKGLGSLAAAARGAAGR